MPSRCRLGRSLAFAALLIQSVPAASGQTQPVTYSQAAQLYNEGKYPEASDAIQTLLYKRPEEFKAYKLCWDLVARTRDNSARLARVKHDLPFLERVPVEKRTEDYYSAYEYALQSIGNSTLARNVHLEHVSRYPSGLAAQEDFLDGARRQPDPVKAEALYAEYLVRFSDNVSWTELAARDRFLLIAKHSDKFDSSRLLTASSDWAKHQLAFVRQFGMPLSYLQALETIAKALVSAHPDQALDYSNQAIAFVESKWPKTDEFDDSYRVRFWPIALQAEVLLGSWKPAVRFGAALVGQLEAGTFLQHETDRSSEAEIRANFARALEMAGDAQHGLEQFGLAATLAPNRENELYDFLARHPDLQGGIATLRPKWRAQVERQQELRDERYKQAILALEVKQPATPFELPLTSARKISLESLQGSPLVLAFWATWCGPCRPEIAELDRLFFSEHTPSAKLLTISVDTEKQVVDAFIKEKRYRFPVALSDGTIDAAYQTSTIPQLYVLDAQGRIRFHVTGYEADGYFDKKINWMIEAALKP